MKGQKFYYIEFYYIESKIIIFSAPVQTDRMRACRQRMTRASPCLMPEQNAWISVVHARFMGYLKSMSSAMRTSASNSVARHS